MSRYFKLTTCILLAFALVGCGTTALPTDPPANNPNAPFRFFVGTSNQGQESVGQVIQVVRDGRGFPISIVGPNGGKISQFGEFQSSLTTKCCFDTPGTYKATAKVDGETHVQYLRVDLSEVLPRVNSVSLDEVNTSAIRVSWTAVADAEAYGVMLYDVDEEIGRLYRTSDMSFTFDSGFSSGKEYEVHVIANSQMPSLDLGSQQLNTSERVSDSFIVP